MKLPHLSQRVNLNRGQAQPLYDALEQLQHELLHRNPAAGRRWTAAEALSLQPLGRLTKRVHLVALRDLQPLRPAPPSGRRQPPKPNRLRVEYDELTTVRLYYARLLASAAPYPDAHLVLTAILGQFHQPSLNLESHIRLPPPAGPGRQAWLL